MHLSSSTDAIKLYMLVRESLAIAFSTEVPQSMAIEQKSSVWRVRQSSETRATIRATLSVKLSKYHVRSPLQGGNAKPNHPNGWSLSAS